MSDLVLQAVMDMKGDIGAVKADIASIKVSLATYDHGLQGVEVRVDDLEKTVSRWKGYMAGVAAVASLVGTFAGFLIEHVTR